MRRTPFMRFCVLALAVLSLALCAPVVSAGKVSQQLNQRLPELKFQGVTLGDAIEFLRDVSGTNMTVNWKALETAGVSKDTPINIHLAGITLRKALDMVLNDASGGDAITYFIDQGVIEITTREIADHNMVTRVYPVEDLLMEIPDFTDAPNFALDQSQNSGGGGGGGQALGQGGGGGQINVTNQLFQNANQTQNNRNLGKTKAERAQDLVDLIQAIIYPDVWKENGGTASIRYFNGMLVVTAPRSVQEAIGGEYD
jgi:general secretion pathway protein D